MSEQSGARFYGRGPNRAETIWRDGILVCVLEDIFTKAEVLLRAARAFLRARSRRRDRSVL